MFSRGVVYIVNKIRPSTEPWGTPYFYVTGVDVHDPIWTVCVRYLRYDSNHLRATPLIPNDWFDRFNNFWWSMVSNAALISSSTKMTPPSLSTVWSRSFCTWRSAVSVLWSCLVANWNISYKLLVFKCSTNWTQTTRFTSIEMKDRLNTGL